MRFSVEFHWNCWLVGLWVQRMYQYHVQADKRGNFLMFYVHAPMLIVSVGTRPDGKRHPDDARRD